jgi:Flp pilus assembly protein TadG
MVVRQLCGGRRGATVVETALVLTPLTMLVFAVFEYGWLLTNWNVLNNAAREGCRYALVNNTSSTISTDVQTTVTTFMAGKSANFNALTVTVSGTHGGTTYTGNAVSALAAGDLISVSVSGQYRFMNIIPFFKTPTTITITSAVTMVCEGGT